MAIESIPLKEEIVRQLFALSNTPFQLGKFRERWESFGWSYQPSWDDEFGFKVQIPGSWPLSAVPSGDTVAGAWYAFCLWEDFSPNDYSALQLYEQGRQEFDFQYSKARQIAEAVLGAPYLTWTDDDKDAYQAQIWEGSNGLLILQQACYDPQFGVEINFWLLEGNRQEFRPSTPLIDAICKNME